MSHLTRPVHRDFRRTLHMGISRAERRPLRRVWARMLLILARVRLSRRDYHLQTRKHAEDDDGTSAKIKPSRCRAAAAGTSRTVGRRGEARDRQAGHLLPPFQRLHSLGKLKCRQYYDHHDRHKFERVWQRQSSV